MNLKRVNYETTVKTENVYSESENLGALFDVESDDNEEIPNNNEE